MPNGKLSFLTVAIFVFNFYTDAYYFMSVVNDALTAKNLYFASGFRPNNSICIIT